MMQDDEKGLVQLHFTKLSLKITHINISETVNITCVTMDIHWIVRVKDWHTI